MTKILLTLLIIFNQLYCLSLNQKQLDPKYTEVKTKIKTKEEVLVESAVAKFNLNVIVKTIRLQDRANFIYDFQTIDKAKNNFIYFHGENSKHISGKNKLWGFYYVYNKIVAINKDIISKFNKEKQIGVVAHEIGHMFGLKHFNDSEDCNFMKQGEDRCQSYNYKQINILKNYTENNLSKYEKEKYMFDKDDYLETINEIKRNKTFTLYLILD